MIRHSQPFQPRSVCLVIRCAAVLLTLLQASMATEGAILGGMLNHVTAPVRFGVRSAVVHMKNRAPSGISSAGAASTRTARLDARQNENKQFRKAQQAYTFPTKSRRRLSKYLAKLEDIEISSIEKSIDNHCSDRKIGSGLSTKNLQQVGQKQKQGTKVLLNRKEVCQAATSKAPQGGGSSVMAYGMRPLLFWENMVAGAVSRSIAQTVMHPANTMKTILQSSRDTSFVSLLHPKSFRMLTRGAGANFILSIPHGAINFAVLEYVRGKMSKVVESNPYLERNAERLGPGLDFISSAISTITCSIVSTPQMMITDNIMAGNYPNMPKAIQGLASKKGINGFYSGWWPGLAGKIPSYALTWTLFQQLKQAQLRIFQRDPTDAENSIMGCLASGATVSIMIPMDTIKTRLVTQASNPNGVLYKGIIDCGARIIKEEGIATFYRGLPPRLVSVVPMIGIQFGVYEFMKKVLVTRGVEGTQLSQLGRDSDAENEEQYGRTQALEEALMEVAADDEQPFPAPHFKRRYSLNGRIEGS